MTTLVMLVSPALSGLAVVLVAMIGSKATRASKAIEGATPAYSELDGRVVALERQVETLALDRTVDRAHIVDVHTWNGRGRPGSIPRPPAWYWLIWPDDPTTTRN